MLILLLSPTFAASIYKHGLDRRTQSYLNEGVVYGGGAQKPLALINVRSKYVGTHNMQRIILDIGDEHLKPLMSPMGSYHAALQKTPRRIVVDLSYIYQSALTEPQIKKILKSSPLIADVKAVMDPEDHSLSLVIDLKSSVAMEVYELKGKARLVLDLKKSPL